MGHVTPPPLHGIFASHEKGLRLTHLPHVGRLDAVDFVDTRRELDDAEVEIALNFIR